MLDDMFKRLNEMLGGKQSCGGCSKAEFIEIQRLSSEEIREWAIILSEEERIKKEANKLAKEKELFLARKKIFTGKIQLRSGEFDTELTMKDGKAFKIECKEECSNGRGGPPSLRDLLPPGMNFPGLE